MAEAKKTAEERIAELEAQLEAREAVVSRKETHQQILQNADGKGSAVLDHGIQTGTLRCKDQLCKHHWETIPLKLRVEELVKFMDMAGPGSRVHSFNNVVNNSHFFYYPEESVVCPCGKEGVVLPPDAKSAFDEEFEERIAESGPGKADSEKSRMQRIKQLREHEAIIKELQDLKHGV